MFIARSFVTEYRTRDQSGGRRLAMLNGPLWLAVRRQTTEIGGIMKQMFYIFHNNAIIMEQYCMQNQIYED